MSGCHDCQDRMLEYLYDLLDEGEQRSLLAHVAVCLSCQAALAAARGQQQLLAVAARASFPEVQFAPPTEAAVAARVVPLPVRTRPVAPRRWGRWAAAAAVLLALTGLAVPTYRAGRDYAAAAGTIHEHEYAVADAREQVEQAKQRLAAAAADRDRQIEAVRYAVKARELLLEVRGPHSVQAGAPATFQVRARDLNGKPAAADITARVSDGAARAGAGPARTALGMASGDRKRADKGEKPAEPALTSRDLTVTEVGVGVYRVSVPPTLRLERGRDLDMFITACRKGIDRAPLTLAGKLQLTAPVYLTHLSTDKPIYQPGEVVRFRSLTLERRTLTPPEETFRLSFSLATPNGAVSDILHGPSQLARLDDKGQPHELTGPDGKPVRGIGAGEYRLDDRAPAGEYTLTVRDEADRFLPVQRKFLVAHPQTATLDAVLEFNRSSYRPGDEGQALVRAARIGGGPAANCPVDVTLLIDGVAHDLNGRRTQQKLRRKTDASGEAYFHFKLPAAIERGEASLAVEFHGGFGDRIVRPLPVALPRLQVEFFPEGGDLVAGLANRVYFQARSSQGKPVQASGELLEDGRPTGVRVATLHDDNEPRANQGLGAFVFTPQFGRRYEVRFDRPAGIAQPAGLPVVRHDGVVLHVPHGVFDAGEPIRVQVRTSQARPLLVGAYCRGQLLDTVQLDGGQTEAVLQPGPGAGGVCRVTVFELLPAAGGQQAKPVAERLVYRHPRERLDVAISTQQKRYAPGQRVSVDLLAVNEREKFTPSLALVRVVDRGAVARADERTARTMPTHFLLTTEVRRSEDLEYADFIVGQHPTAPAVLDMLLGTQGWRRFAEQDPRRFEERLAREAPKLSESEREQRRQEAERLLVMIGQSSPQRTDFDQQKIDRVLADFDAQAARIQREFGDAAQAVAQAGDEDDYQAARAVLAHYHAVLDRARAVLVPLLAAVLFLLALFSVALALTERLGRGQLLAGLAVGCAALLLFVGQGPPLLRLPRPLVGSEVARLVVPPAKTDRAWEVDAVESQADRTTALADSPDRPRMAPPPVSTDGRWGRAGGKALVLGRGLRARTAPGRPGVAPLRRPGEGGTGRPQAAMAGKGSRDGSRGGFGALPPAPMPPSAPGGVAPGAVPPGVRMDAESALLRPELRRSGTLGDGKDKRDLAEASLVVREYAHVHPTPVGSPSDFAETVYWHPVLVLADGKANFSFDLPDSLTTFEITAFAHTLDGRLGAAARVIEARVPAPMGR